MTESPTQIDLSGLRGLVVINKRHGVGRIDEIGEKRTTIGMWVNDNRYPKKDDSLLFQWVFNNMTDPDRTLKWGFETDKFLDNDDWAVAPDGSNMEEILHSIRSHKSPVVIHTSNPPRPYEQSEQLELEMKEFARSQSTDSFDKDLLTSTNAIKNGADRALNLFLLRSRENDQSYHERLSRLDSSLGVNAFADVIFPAMPEDWQEIFAMEVAFLAGVYCLTFGPDTRDGLSDVLGAIEQRLMLHEKIIRGFTHSYNDEWLKKMIRRGGPTTRITHR